MLDNTRAVVNNITKRLKRLVKILDILCQFVLLILCAYNVYKNLGNLVRLIIFSAMGALSVAWFIYTIAYYFNKDLSRINKNRRKVSGRVIKYTKLFYRLVLVGYAIFEVVYYDRSLMTVVLTLLSAFSFIFQVFITIVFNTITNYMEYLELALEEDIKPFSNMYNRGRNIIEGIKNPLYGISCAFTKDEEEKKTDKRTDKKLEDIYEMREEWQEGQKEKQALKKASFLEHKKQTIDRFKQKIKDVFKKKKKSEQGDNKE